MRIVEKILLVLLSAIVYSPILIIGGMLIFYSTTSNQLIYMGIFYAVLMVFIGMLIFTQPVFKTITMISPVNERKTQDILITLSSCAIISFALLIGFERLIESMLSISLSSYRAGIFMVETIWIMATVVNTEYQLKKNYRLTEV